MIELFLLFIFLVFLFIGCPLLLYIVQKAWFDNFKKSCEDIIDKWNE